MARFRDTTYVDIWAFSVGFTLKVIQSPTNIIGWLSNYEVCISPFCIEKSAKQNHIPNIYL